MTNLTDRLRSLASDPNIDMTEVDLLAAVASKIDALETALHKIASYTAPGHHETGWDFELGCMEMPRIAREALEATR